MSTDLPTASPCLVRPPWPDEMPRLADAFPLPRFNRALHPLVLVVPGAPERIVGIAGVLEPLDGHSGLTCLLRPRHRDSPDGDRLITAALELARSLGARLIRSVDDLPPDSPLTPALLRAGFTVETTREICELSPAALAPRLERIQSRLAAEPGLKDLVIEPLGPASLPGVMELLAATDLLSAEHRYNLELPVSGYDFPLSFVARRDDRIVAAALVKAQPRAAILDVLAVDREHRGGFNAPGCLVLQAVTRACLATGFPLIFVADQKHGSALLQKVRRAGGRNRGAVETLILHFLHSLHSFQVHTL